LLPQCKCNETHFLDESQQIHRTSIFDLIWFNDDTRLLTASADETCLLFDIQTQQVMDRGKDHNGSIKSIAKTEDESLIATGGRDGKIVFYDVR
jgi:WD40 repeat protein